MHAVGLSGYLIEPGNPGRFENAGAMAGCGIRQTHAKLTDMQLRTGLLQQSAIKAVAADFLCDVLRCNQGQLRIDVVYQVAIDLLQFGIVFRLGGDLQLAATVKIAIKFFIDDNFFHRVDRTHKRLVQLLGFFLADARSQLGKIVRQAAVALAAVAA